MGTSDVSKPVLTQRIAKKLFDFHTTSIDEERKPGLFSTTRNMLKMAQELTFDDASKQKAFQAINLKALVKEVSDMEKICAASGSPVVYSHNDLLPGIKCNYG